MTDRSGQRPATAPPYVGYALVRVAHLLSQRLDRRLTELGLSATAFGVLFQLRLDVEGSLSSAELARRVIMTPQSVGPLLGKLERSGLVERVSAGEPGTSISRRLTPMGHERLVQAMSLVQEVDDEMVAGLDPAQRASLGDQLWDLLGHISPTSSRQQLS